jgi:hypothetical protein
MRESMKIPIELLLSFSSFIIHNSSFSFIYPLAKVGEGRSLPPFFDVPGEDRDTV